MCSSFKSSSRVILWTAPFGAGLPERELAVTEPISQKPLHSPRDLQRQVVDKSKAVGDAPPATPDQGAKPIKGAGADEFLSTNVVQRAKAEPAYDKAKVEAIKKAIQDAQYPLDSRRIAESFHALEKLIRD